MLRNHGSNSKTNVMGTWAPVACWAKERNLLSRDGATQDGSPVNEVLSSMTEEQNQDKYHGQETSTDETANDIIFLILFNVFFFCLFPFCRELMGFYFNSDYYIQVAMLYTTYYLFLAILNHLLNN